MAKIASTAEIAPARPRDDKYDEWRVESAMETMMRASEIVADKKMMGLVVVGKVYRKEADFILALTSAAASAMEVA